MDDLCKIPTILPLFDAFVLAPFHYRVLLMADWYKYIETEGSSYHLSYPCPPSCFFLPF